nr:zinc finger, CCHC-type [Tanacetum cinerariifolium]
MDESIQVSCIIDKLSHSWKYFKHTLKYLKEELTLIELGSHLCIEESLRVHDIVEHNNSTRYNDNKGKWKHHDTKVDPNKKLKVTCWKYRKPRHLATKAMDQVNDVAWWVDSRATVHVCKDRCWFKTYESLNDGSILHMKNESTTLVHGRGCAAITPTPLLPNHHRHRPTPPFDPTTSTQLSHHVSPPPTTPHRPAPHPDPTVPPRRRRPPTP